MFSDRAVSADRRAGLTHGTRAASLAAVAVLHAALFYALLHGLGGRIMPQGARPAVIAYDVPPAPTPSPTPPPAPPPPTPPPSPEPQASQSAQTKAPAPPAPRATPRARVTPQARLILVPDAPAVPPVTGSGSDARAGAAESGTGSGAEGAGSGGGAGGAGGAGGEGSGAGVLARRAEKIGGELKARDFPRSGAADRNGRAIVVRFLVGTDGRVRQCRVTQSSGNGEVDAITCRLIEQRFRYRPAFDRLGQPMTDETGWKQWWWQ